MYVSLSLCTLFARGLKRNLEQREVSGSMILKGRDSGINLKLLTEFVTLAEYSIVVLITLLQPHHRKEN